MTRRRTALCTSFIAITALGLAVLVQSAEVDQRVTPADPILRHLAVVERAAPTTPSPVAPSVTPVPPPAVIPAASPLAPAPSVIPVVPTSRPNIPTPTAEVKSVTKAPKATHKPKAEAKTQTKSQTKTKVTKKPVYKGKNMFWYPALGIKAKIKGYGCKYGGDPRGIGRGLYTWGCSGKNNTYLLAHAYSTFHPIQLGYHNGRLKKGGIVYYADAKGKVTRYKVAWIKRIPLKTWKTSQFGYFASMDRTTMTLQTCDGSRSQYRIVVRLYPG